MLKSNALWQVWGRYKIIEESLSILFSFILLGNLNRQNVIPCDEGCSSLYCSYDENLTLSWLFNLILFSNSICFFFSLTLLCPKYYHFECISLEIHKNDLSVLCLWGLHLKCRIASRRI